MTMAPAPPEGRPAHRSAAAVVLSLTGLATLALTQPLLDLVGRNAAFLVAHGLGRLDVIVLTAGLLAAAPMAGAGAVLLVRAVHRRAAAMVHDLLIAALAAAGVLWTLRVSGLGMRLSGVVALIMALVLGAGFATAYHRSAAFRRLLSYTALAAPVAGLAFLLATPVRSLLLPAADGRAIAATGPRPPVVLVIFDELPLATLLDGDHRVDAEAFPAFARLAQDATFFRNATGSHSSTVEAVPSLLSGRYVQVNTLPTASAHPTNLFSLLDDAYRVHALEPLTDLCSECRDETAPADQPNTAALLRDLGVLQLHLVAPDDWVRFLPPVDAEWRDFGADESATLDREGFLTEARGALRQDSPAAFRRFTREITDTGRPTLHMLHTLLPHRPWRYLPDGRRHGAAGEPSLGEDGWTPLGWPMAQSQQLHLAQSRLSDRLLGQLLDRLDQTGLYDRSLLVVVADHGLSLLPGTPPRDITPASLPEIAPVPLFVKPPGQTTGTVDDRPVETVDVVPTVLDILGVDAPDSLDGVSLLAGDVPPRTSRRMVDADGKTWDVGTSQAALFDTVRRKLELFGDSGGSDLFALAPSGYDQLFNRRVGAPPPAPGLSVTLERARAYQEVRLDSPVVPALVAGQVHGLPKGGPTSVLAVAVNGVIAAVTLAETGHGPHGSFRALVSPDAFRNGSNDVTVLRVGAGGSLAEIPRTP